jgi:ribonuclease VapC
MSNGRVFLDTSALIAVLADEPDAPRAITALETARECFTSPLVILEASMRLASILRVTPTDAEHAVREFLEAGNVRIANLGDATASLAVSAFERFGKGRGHPAQLNLADCFSYAVAAELRASILFIGNDFSRTDLTAA